MLDSWLTFLLGDIPPGVAVLMAALVFQNGWLIRAFNRANRDVARAFGELTKAAAAEGLATRKCLHERFEEQNRLLTRMDEYARSKK